MRVSSLSFCKWALGVHIIKSLSQCIQTLHHQLNSSFPINKGVRQGDMLSPLLFNLFINDVIPEFQGPECLPPELKNEKVGCLLYADDLVIISTAPEGLQNSLNNLNSYCQKWKLEVNLAKSKSMCLSKRKSSQKGTEFKINNTPLEFVKHYSYLGIVISSTGNFKEAEQAISLKASKALFKLKSLIYNSDLKPSVCLKLFDQLIKPIACYGSELWGVDVIKTRGGTTKLYESLSKLKCEKLCLSYSRFILGVHKKSQISAIQGELGRYPLGIDVIANTLMYLKHLQSDTVNSLLKEAVEQMRK